MKPGKKSRNMIEHKISQSPHTSNFSNENNNLPDLVGSQSSLIIHLQNGDVIEYKINNNDPWNRAMIISRGSRKSSNGRKNVYNIQNVQTGKKLSINLNLIRAWRKIHADSSLINEKITLAWYLKDNWTKIYFICLIDQKVK